MAGSFYRVKCPDCENEQTVFGRASTEVACAVCGHTLARPTGGEADIEGEVVDVVAAR
jgi:small subunit ribosomal protein S27e